MKYFEGRKRRAIELSNRENPTLIFLRFSSIYFKFFGSSFGKKWDGGTWSNDNIIMLNDGGPAERGTTIIITNHHHHCQKSARESLSSYQNDRLEF